MFEVVKIFFGFFQSLYYLLKLRPSLIYSSGGYLSVPVVIAGFLLGIPSITHEQTVVSGWANRAISPFVKKILLVHKSSENNFRKDKVEVVGMPVRKELIDPTNCKVFNPKLLYITCGKQGSHLINDVIFPLVPELVKDFTVVHQVGANVLTKDLDRARRIKEKLGELANRYHFASYYFAKDSSTYLQSADVVISRAGAHTVYELILLKKKAVIIPLSWVSHNEQNLNAQLAKTETGAIVLEENEINPDLLLSAIKKISAKPKTKMTAKLKNDVTERIVEIIQKQLR